MINVRYRFSSVMDKKCTASSVGWAQSRWGLLNDSMCPTPRWEPYACMLMGGLSIAWLLLRAPLVWLSFNSRKELGHRLWDSRLVHICSMCRWWHVCLHSVALATIRWTASLWRFRTLQEPMLLGEPLPMLECVNSQRKPGDTHTS